MEAIEVRRGQLMVFVGLFGHYEVGAEIRNHLKIVNLPPFYASCFGWSWRPGHKVGQLVFTELEYSRVPIIGYTSVDQIKERLSSLGYQPGVVIICNADRFCGRDTQQVAKLLDLSKALQSEGTNVVITGKPTPQMFVLMSHAEIPVRSQTPTCRAQHKTGVCGHPASAWVWYNSLGIIPIYEFLRILLTPFFWLFRCVTIARRFFVNISRNSKTHYPKTLIKPDPFYPGWLFALQTIFFGPLDLQGRCLAHQNVGDEGDHYYWEI